MPRFLLGRIVEAQATTRRGQPNGVAACWLPRLAELRRGLRTRLRFDPAVPEPPIWQRHAPRGYEPLLQRRASPEWR